MPHANQRSVEELARRLKVGATMAIVLTAVITAVAMTGGIGNSVVAVNVDGEGLSRGPTAICAFVVGALCVGFLCEIRLVLGRIVGGDCFGPGVRLHLVRASLYMLAGCLANIVLPPVLMLAWPAASGTARHFTLEVNGSDALWLLTATCLFFVARLLERAAAIEADNQQIV